MAFIEDNWQTKGTVYERITFLWNSDLLSDVKFVVPESTGECDRKVIPAHKFVLAISSPVFYTMFYGQMAETTDSIELPDCEYESLLEFFAFLYSDEVNLTERNVMHVFYLAKKYIVPSLVDKCTEYLRDILEASNVFSILSHAQIFEDKDLEDRCWEVIEMDTQEAVTSKEFVTLERSLVESIVKRECLHIKEIELFEAVDRWTIKECERQGMNPSGEAKRRIIGEEIVKAIRFPLMSQKEFISVVPDCNILTTKEIVDMMKHFNDVLTSPLQFLTAPRVKAITSFHECHRFERFRIPGTSWSYMRGKSDHICFTVTKDIRLCGVRHFGDEGGRHTASVEVKDTKNGLLLTKQSGSYSSEVKHHGDNTYYSYDVMFDQPVCLVETNHYEIVSLICGGVSWYGNGGKKSVECCGVVFTFSDSRQLRDSNGTDTLGGQFPALLFST